MIDTTTAYRCNECDAISEDNCGPVYGCGNCGNISDERRCDLCNRFKAKLSDIGCAECCAGEVEEVQAITCECHNEWHAVAG